MPIKIAVASGKGGTEKPNDMLFFPELELATESTIFQEIPYLF